VTPGPLYDRDGPTPAEQVRAMNAATHPTRAIEPAQPADPPADPAARLSRPSFPPMPPGLALDRSGPCPGSSGAYAQQLRRPMPSSSGAIAGEAVRVRRHLAGEVGVGGSSHFRAAGFAPLPWGSLHMPLSGLTRLESDDYTRAVPCGRCRAESGCRGTPSQHRRTTPLVESGPSRGTPASRTIVVDRANGARQHPVRLAR
jgi:hypothetical protein